MKLIYEDTGVPVKVGDEIAIGDTVWIITGITNPMGGGFTAHNGTGPIPGNSRPPAGHRRKTMSTATQTPASATKAPRAPRGSEKADATKAPRKARGDKAARKPAAPKRTPKAVNLSGKSTDALRQAAAHYVHDKERKTAGGHVSVNNGDEIAQKLLGKDLDAVYAMAAKALKEEESDLRAKYKHLNVGMQRMCLGNRMRAAAK